MRDFVRGYVVTMRPYLLFVSGITGIVGMALAPAAPWTATLLLGAVFFLSYGFGQALTDCFQTDTDALSAPYRPLVQGTIRRRDVLLVSLAGLLASGVVVTWYQRANLGLALLAVVGLATYTWFKRRWWAGPLYNAWIVGVLALVAHWAALGAASVRAPWNPVLTLTLGAVFFGYANFVLTGYYKDVAADRATGYRTLPVAFGLGVSTIVSDAFATLELAAAAAAAWTLVAPSGLAPGQAPALALLGAGAAAATLAQVRLHGVRNETTAHRAITPVVHAYLLLLAGIGALAKPAWAPALVLFYLAFALMLSRRPMPQQI